MTFFPSAQFLLQSYCWLAFLKSLIIPHLVFPLGHYVNMEVNLDRFLSSICASPLLAAGGLIGLVSHVYLLTVRATC